MPGLGPPHTNPSLASARHGRVVSSAQTAAVVNSGGRLGAAAGETRISEEKGGEAASRPGEVTIAAVAWPGPAWPGETGHQEQRDTKSIAGAQHAATPPGNYDARVAAGCPAIGLGPRTLPRPPGRQKLSSFVHRRVCARSKAVFSNHIDNCRKWALLFPRASLVMFKVVDNPATLPLFRARPFCVCKNRCNFPCTVLTTLLPSGSSIRVQHVCRG